MSSPSLLGIPRELRDRIYDFVFPCDEIHPLFFGGKASFWWRPITHTWPGAQEVLALLSVNHQVSAEAASHFYGRNKFVGDAEEVNRFLRGIGQKKRDSVNSVKIRAVTTRSLAEIIESLNTLGKLTVLDIEVHLSQSVADIEETLVEALGTTAKNARLTITRENVLVYY